MSFPRGRRDVFMAVFPGQFRNQANCCIRERNKPDVSTVAEPVDSRYSMSMQKAETILKPTAEKVALAQQAFQEFHARCFWFMRPDAKIVPEELPYICERLRADGGRRGFFIAAEICR